MVQVLDGRYYRCAVTGGGRTVYSEGAQITLAETELVIDDVVYAVVDGKMTVTGYRGNAASVTVQQTVDGQTVTVIGESAFDGCTGLLEITIPPNVNRLEERAFRGCTGLKRVTLSPGRLLAIGEEAFSGCTALTEIRIPDHVRVILKRAFSGCSSLKNVDFSSVYKIVRDTSGVEHIEGLTELAPDAFEGTQVPKEQVKEIILNIKTKKRRPRPKVFRD